MKETLKKFLLEWWERNTTTRMPLPTFYTYDVQVDGKTIQIETMSRSRMYVHYKARKMYPDAKSINVKGRLGSIQSFKPKGGGCVTSCWHDSCRIDFVIYTSYPHQYGTA